MRDVKTHYLRRNHAEWSPPATIFLDTETRELPERAVETLGLRCWVAHYIDRRTPRQAAHRDSWGHGTATVELVAWIDQVTRNRGAVWLYAHNLAFDLVTTRLPLHLVNAGWRVTDASIGGKAPWIRLARKNRRLTLVDSWSWLPTALENIGQAVGLDKPPLPSSSASMDEWQHRCTEDVRILEAAVLGLMDWWDRQKLGRWTISGAATGWNAYRHTLAGERVVVETESGGTKRDRLAVHGGRRGTWAIGEHRAGPFYELDFTAAYPTIARDCPLPAARTRLFDSLPTSHAAVGSARWGIVASCRIKTDTPRWPVRIDRHTWYPTGEFWADLAGPEIAEAKRLGCLVEIGPGAMHKLNSSMSRWAAWCLDTQNGVAPDSPPVARVACKSWGRSVIGRWAAHGFDKVKLGTSPHPDWHYETGIAHGARARGGMVDLGGLRWWVEAGAETDNSYPAVLAWVESEVRARLTRTVEAIGPGAVLQCDTDGLIVAGRTIGTRAARGHLVAPEGLSDKGRLDWVLAQLNPVTAPLDLRVKRRADHVHVMGPQHLIVDGQQRLAGIPRGAELDDDGHYKVKTWPNLKWQMEHGSAEGYVRPERRPMVKGPYPTGWILADGRVVPVEARIGRDGATTMVPWLDTSHVALGARRGPLQHKALERYL